MVSQPRPFVTPEEYLAAERRATTKSEYHDGEIVAMAGASREHNLIVFDTVREFSIRLRGRPCEGYSNDMRVWLPAARAYVYPDIVVVCGEPTFQDGTFDTLLNPTLIVEILSPATAAYDQGEKFALYRSLPSLREYILIHQDQPRLALYRRDPDGRWFIGDAHGLDATIDLAVGGGITLALRDLYERITFAPPASPAGAARADPAPADQ